jgi:hypothetical protein
MKKLLATVAIISVVAVSAGAATTNQKNCDVCTFHVRPVTCDECKMKQDALGYPTIDSEGNPHAFGSGQKVWLFVIGDHAYMDRICIADRPSAPSCYWVSADKVRMPDDNGSRVTSLSVAATHHTKRTLRCVEKTGTTCND